VYEAAQRLEKNSFRFRNLLTQLKLWDGLLREVNRQLEEVGLKVKEPQGAIIDATIIESVARPRREQ
jgi:IS5 family transposase